MNTQINTSGDLNSINVDVMGSWNDIEKGVNVYEVEEVKELVEECDKILKEDTEVNDSIVKYEIIYKKLNDVVMKKNAQIKGLEERITKNKEPMNDDNLVTVLNKKKINTNRIIDCVNNIVKRIKEKEDVIYDNRMGELNNMEIERYDVVRDTNPINDSMWLLKEWSETTSYNIIFDSKVDGNGGDNVLHDKVFGKTNLYFITVDCYGNVFGGYISNKIDKSNSYVSDKNSFVFSLIRNHEVKNVKYPLKHSCDNAFQLYSNDSDKMLYTFGWDFWVYQVGYGRSFCNLLDEYCFYGNKKEKYTFVDYAQFEVKQLIVIEMV
ncbi:TLDc domain-containing protein [Entamoeba marina]